MKINDKHLVSFVNSNAPTDKEGWLYKRGEVNKAFQKRWFVLKGNLLFYFDKKIDKEPIGVIIVEGCTVELAVNNDDNYYTFELVFPGSASRTYVLATDTQEEMETWMKAITCAGYEYMKVMVTELQRQLDEVTMLNTNAMQWTRSQSQRSNATGGQAPLIDISDTSGENAGANANARFNPFDREPDIASASLYPGSGRSSRLSQGFRSFDEVHETYGAFIRQKLAQSQRHSPK